MVVVVAALGILLAIVFSLLQNAYIVKNRIQARQSVIQGMYYLYEKINQFSQDYTIDYEEYRARSIVGCDQSLWSQRDVWEDGICGVFTAYGNYNSIPTLWSYDRHGLYYCSSTDDQLSPLDPDYVIQSNGMLNGEWCVNQIENIAHLFPTSGTYYQSYGQYARQSWDVQGDADGTWWIIEFGNETWTRDGPSAITDTGIQEIYLINNNDTQRLYIRRRMIASGDRNGDNIISEPEQHFIIEILRLKGIDAGSEHNQTNEAGGVADGDIDTWACDADQWFICSGIAVGAPYTDMYVPVDIYDGWVQLTEDDISIIDRSIQISPSKNPVYVVDELDNQVSPYITITATAVPYAKIWQQKLWLDTDFMKYAYTVGTTFAAKTVYTR
jgi:hypothetical protein